MGEQKRSNWWKWAAGAAMAGAAAFGGIMAFNGSNDANQTGVRVTPTAIVAEATPEPERTVTVTRMPSPTLSPTPTPTPEPEVTVTPEPTVAETPTPELTEEPSPIPTEEIKPTDTVMPTQIPTNTPTVTPTVSPKPTATPTVKPTATPTNTPSPSPKPTATPTDTPTPTPSNTPTPAPVAWTEPKERKDIADLLMTKVNAYRTSKGLRKWENPFVYYDVNNPGLGERLTAKGIRVAKKCCLEHSANHEGSQIATGVYYYPWQVTDAWLDEMAGKLFDNWYDSTAHNKNMLDNHADDGIVDVAVMSVVEYFDGEYWHYCAIMTVSGVFIDVLPEGLK